MTAYNVKASRTITRLTNDSIANVTLTSITNELVKIEADMDVLCTVQGDQLKIESEGGGGGGRLVMASGLGSVIGNFFGSGGGSVYSSGSVMTVNGVRIESSGRTFKITGAVDKLFLNGTEMVAATSRAAKEARAVSTDDEEVKSKSNRTWTLQGAMELTSITVSGSSDLSVASAGLLAPRLQLQVTGSGGCTIPSTEFTNLSATVSGSGSLQLGGSRAGEVAATVTGSGEIGGFHAISSCRVVLTGSGDVRGKRAKGCDLERTITGSGEVHVEKI